MKSTYFKHRQRFDFSQYAFDIGRLLLWPKAFDQVNAEALKSKNGIYIFMQLPLKNKIILKLKYLGRGLLRNHQMNSASLHR